VRAVHCPDGDLREYTGAPRPLANHIASQAPRHKSNAAAQEAPRHELNRTDPKGCEMARLKRADGSNAQQPQAASREW
jgi:hypothetical protein